MECRVILCPHPSNEAKHMNTKTIELRPNQTVLVLGGRGFIGRHVVSQLESLGAMILIGTRGKQGFHEPSIVKIQLHATTKIEQWLPHLEGVDVVVNAVGIMRQRFNETFDKVHHLAVASLAKACEQKNIRLVHISALGIEHPVKSRFSSSKLRGENAIKHTKADWYIVKPSLVDGEGGYGAQWFRRIAQWPVHIAPATAKGMLTPIDVKDLAEAVAKISLKTQAAKDSKDRIYELGSNSMRLFDYLATLNGGQRRYQIRIPSSIARPISHLFDLLHITPFSFGHYELLQYNNCPVVDRLPEILGRPATLIACQGKIQFVSIERSSNIKLLELRVEKVERASDRSLASFAQRAITVIQANR